MCSHRILGTCHALSTFLRRRNNPLTTGVRRVGVHPVEVGRSFYDSPFFRNEFWEAIVRHSFHVLRMMSEIRRALYQQSRERAERW